MFAIAHSSTLADSISGRTTFAPPFCSVTNSPFAPSLMVDVAARADSAARGLGTICCAAPSGVKVAKVATAWAPLRRWTSRVQLQKATTAAWKGLTAKPLRSSLKAMQSTLKNSCTLLRFVKNCVSVMFPNTLISNSISPASKLPMSSAISKSSLEDASPLFALAFIFSNSSICAGVNVLLEIASPDDPRAAAWSFLNIAAFARAVTLITSPRFPSFELAKPTMPHTI